MVPIFYITSINGVELPHDEAIVLSNGDRIVMGKTQGLLRLKAHPQRCFALRARDQFDSLILRVLHFEDDATIGAFYALYVLAGQQYVLRQGANTVGRKAQTSQATLQLPVSDPYMSRHHQS